MSVIKAEYFQPKIDNPQSEADFDKVYFETSADQVIGLHDELANYLPLSGGTMSDTITISNNSIALKRDTDTTSLQINGADSYQNGAYVVLYGKNNSDTDHQGAFQLSAKKDFIYSLFGRADGTLKWNGKEVERVSASDTNYIRYESGLQICWAVVNSTVAAGSDNTATLPANFKDANYSVLMTRAGDSYKTVYTKNRTVSNFKFVSDAGSGYSFVYIAVGYWK